MSAYALYYYDQCPFCQMVLREIRNMNVDVALKNTLTDPQNRQALVAGGGRGMVPCLLITDEQGSQQWLYESRDIIRYIKQVASK